MFDIITYALCKKQISDALAGAGALKGDKGEPGKSAYELAVAEGYTGSQSDWLESLRGEPGYTPYIGDNNNWFINGTDTGVAATGTIRISSENNSQEIVVNEENGTISSIVDGVEVIVANYEPTAAI